MGVRTGHQRAICWHTDGLLDTFTHLLGERQTDPQKVQANQGYLCVA